MEILILNKQIMKLIPLLLSDSVTSGKENAHEIIKKKNQ